MAKFYPRLWSKIFRSVESWKKREKTIRLERKIAPFDRCGNSGLLFRGGKKGQKMGNGDEPICRVVAKELLYISTFVHLYMFREHVLYDEILFYYAFSV